MPAERVDCPDVFTEYRIPGMPAETPRLLLLKFSRTPPPREMLRRNLRLPINLGQYRSKVMTPPMRFIIQIPIGRVTIGRLMNHEAAIQMAPSHHPTSRNHMARNTSGRW